MRRSVVSLFCVVAGAGCCLVPARTPAPRWSAADPAVELARALNALASVRSDGAPEQNDDPTAAPLLSSTWKLLARSAVVRLSAVRVTKSEVQRTLSDLGCPGAQIDCSVVPLSEQLFLVLTYLRDSEVGSFFILDCRRQSVPPVAWTMEAFAEAHAHENRHLQDWPARRWYGDWSGYHVTLASALPDNGVVVSVSTLGPRMPGKALTVGAQLSVWAWNGQEAAILLAGEYAWMLDDDARIVFDEDVVKVPTKEDFTTFWTNGASKEPRGVWPIRVTPTGIEDLRPRHVVPELRLIDALFYRIQRRQPATDIASSGTISFLLKMIPDARRDLTPDNDYDPLGEMWGWRRTPTRRGFRVCLDVDTTGPLEYTIEYEKGRPRIMGVRKVTTRSIDAPTAESSSDPYDSLCNQLRTG